MACVIADSCIKESLWACVPACTSDAIHALEDVLNDREDFIEKNVAIFKQ